MKKFNSLLMAVFCICSYQVTFAQTGTLCDGNKGPNLLGTRGTFTYPSVLPNTAADECLRSGSTIYNPIDNVGMKLEGCDAPSGQTIPCSDYTYTDKNLGMMPEFTYSLLKVLGDEDGTNCIHTKLWVAKDHTGAPNSYFLAVNGAANHQQTPIFYQIKNIPVCIGATYEFSAFVKNMVINSPANASAPNVSFVVNGETIGTSGSIAYSEGWKKVGGSFVATTNSVDLKVINATFVAGGNDIALDDISINVCQSQITVDLPSNTCEGNTVTPHMTVLDPTPDHAYTWYRWQVSRDGGINFLNLRTANDITYVGNTADLSYDITNVSTDENAQNRDGNIYRLIVATSRDNLSNPDCRYIQDYTLSVASCGPTPVKLVSFNGTYSKGVASLHWQTSQELNNDRFELFRSFDGVEFTLAATVEGAGNSFTPKNYSYEDHVALSGNYVFYKLKQIDIDGKFTFSDVIKLSMSSANASFQIFPNPVVNNFTANFSASKSDKATVVIRSTNGQTVFRQVVDVMKGNNSVLISAPQLKTGMYYVSIVNDEINYNGKLQKL